jgi:hypothetical protein
MESSNARQAERQIPLPPGVGRIGLRQPLPHLHRLRYETSAPSRSPLVSKHVQSVKTPVTSTPGKIKANPSMLCGTLFGE